MNVASGFSATFRFASPPTAQSDAAPHDPHLISQEELRSGKSFEFQDINLRRLPNVDSVKLNDAKRHYILWRLYVDELHGRNGTGIPVNEE
ncbi:hypothetical protein [Noviherbaspirillum sp.]|jgi:hypothetical protein|uniref:hypothetical protein n=1 Tax=Noviherbaspirillum sp. TaxID=1926288 RepID=UPI0025E12135|nr:hypothetical protein [Noviherbaspirillum sp.]